MKLKDHTDRDFDVVAFMTSEMIERLHRHPNIHDLVKSGVSDTGHMAAILVAAILADDSGFIRGRVDVNEAVE